MDLRKIVLFFRERKFMFSPEKTNIIRPILRDSLTAYGLISLALVTLRYFTIPPLSFISYIMQGVLSALIIFILIWFLSDVYHLLHSDKHKKSDTGIIVFLIATLLFEIIILRHMYTVLLTRLS